MYQVLKFLDFGFRSKLALGHSQEGLKFVLLVAGMCIHGSQKKLRNRPPDSHYDIGFRLKGYWDQMNTYGYGYMENQTENKLKTKSTLGLRRGL